MEKLILALEFGVMMESSEVRTPVCLTLTFIYGQFYEKAELPDLRESFMRPWPVSESLC